MSTLPKDASAIDQGDALLETVDLLRLDAARRLNPDQQMEMGQFMTPSPVAQLMASMFEGGGRSVRLLDAGAGVGSLVAAWVGNVGARQCRPQEIAVTAYEIDQALAAQLRISMQACAAHCEALGIRFRADIREEDFIAAAVAATRGDLFATIPERFDCAILNPPYRKLHAESRARRLLETVGAETTNLYTAFLSLAVELLRPGGELVAITPRSFCNGPYFRSFRQSFLDRMALRRVHAFESRDRAFSEEDVLQENVIVYAIKAVKQQASVVVSASLSPEDQCPTWREVELSKVVSPEDPDRFIHIPADALSEAVTERLGQFTSSLADLGLEASTGRVVDFRSAPFLQPIPGPATVPLIYPGHLADGFVRWPKASKKPNALTLTPETESLLVPRGFYVLVKRFSSKEERRRIVAAVYDPARLPASDVAFENHLNYFHAAGRPLSRDLAHGLATFLNSTLVDSYFRDWSGHTQVNASDLRRFKYPSRHQLEKLGAAIGEDFPDQVEVDRRIEEDLLDLSRLRTADPVSAKKRIREALGILKDLGLPREQQNDRSALTLLALLDLKPKTPWEKAQAPPRGITKMMGFFKEHYGKVYAPNTRETVRRFTVHQFVLAGLAIPNPDEPSRPTNSPRAVYQIESGALNALRTFGSPDWDKALQTYLGSRETLQKRYAREREMERIPLTLTAGTTISLSPGGQNILVKEIVEEFCPRFTPQVKPIYVGDTDEKWAHFDEPLLKGLGVTIDPHGKMPDVVVFHEAKGWLVLIEAVTSHGPVNPKRRHELQQIFAGAKPGLVFVTAFLTRKDLVKYLGDIAWETEVWVAEAPSHLIHFNGERFLGPF